MLLTNISVNKACTTERGNRYLPVVSWELCPYYHNYNATNYITRHSISNSSVVKTGVFGHEFESQTCIFFPFFPFFFFFFYCWLAFFFLLSSLSGVYALHDPRISRDSEVSNIFFTKRACCQFTFNSIVKMATLSGTLENGTRNNVH